MSDEHAIRRKAREAIQAGKLPSRRPEHMFGGAGAGVACTICGQPVAPEELEFELEFALNGGNGAQVSHHLHTRCFAAWELERQSVKAVPSTAAAPAGVAPDGHHLLLADADVTIPDRECQRIHKAGRA